MHAASEGLDLSDKCTERIQLKWIGYVAFFILSKIPSNSVMTHIIVMDETHAITISLMLISQENTLMQISIEKIEYRINKLVRFNLRTH